jgi:hypothetical protein
MATIDSINANYCTILMTISECCLFLLHSKVAHSLVGSTQKVGHSTSQLKEAFGCQSDSLEYRIKINKLPMHQKYSLRAPLTIEVFASNDWQEKVYVPSWMTISLEPSKAVNIVLMSVAQLFDANMNTAFQRITLDIHFRMCSSIFGTPGAPLPSPSLVNNLQSTIYQQLSSNFPTLRSKPDYTICT